MLIIIEATKTISIWNTSHPSIFPCILKIFAVAFGTAVPIRR